ncbi:MAG: hypothetical protein AAF570_15090, partial [Bacteroidota bacterium]
MLSYLLVQSILLILPFDQVSVLAQCPGRYYQYLDGNGVKARINNSSDHHWDLNGESAYEVPVGSGHHAGFVNALWVGGLDEVGDLHVAAMTYRQLGFDFYSGPYRSSGDYNECSTGTNFETPMQVFRRGLYALQGGEIMALYANGYTIHDQATGVTLDKTLPVTKNLYTATELADGRIFLFGEDFPGNPTDALMVNPNNNWDAAVATQLQYAHKHSLGTLLSGGSVLITGLFGCEIYDPATNNSIAIPSMGTPRGNHSAIVLPSGKVFVAGGAGNFAGIGYIPTTEIYDPYTNAWSAGPVMATGRIRPGLTLLPNGKVLITGGHPSNPSFQEYDEITNTLTNLTAPAEAFDDHVVIPLTSGEYLISYVRQNSGWGAAFRYNYTNQTFTPFFFSTMGIEGVPLNNGNIALSSEVGNPIQFYEIDPYSGTLVGQPYQYIWKLDRAQINQFRQDFQNGTVNFANYPDIESWPAHGNTAIGEDQYLAPFIDANMDGFYNPADDGDYPCIVGDQALWWVFHDDGPHEETDSEKLGIQVKATAYAFDCNSSQCPSTTIDSSTFYHYEITNRSNHDYENVYAGIWQDADLGLFLDDFVGCDTNLNLAFAYNADSIDEGVYGYGAHPPAAGTMILNGGTIDRMTN